MPRMILIASVLMLLSVASDAGAEVKGHCEYESRKATFVDGVAWPVLDEDSGEATGEQLLVFSSYALDEDVIWRAKANDREDAMRGQHQAGGESARLQLTLRPDEGMVSQYLWLSPGTNLSRSGNQIGEYQPATATAGRVAGHYRLALFALAGDSFISKWPGAAVMRFWHRIGRSGQVPGTSPGNSASRTSLRP